MLWQLRNIREFYFYYEGKPDMREQVGVLKLLKNDWLDDSLLWSAYWSTRNGYCFLEVGIWCHFEMPLVSCWPSDATAEGHSDITILGGTSQHQWIL